MGLKGRMKKLYKLGCALDRRKPEGKNLSCDQFESIHDDIYEWCDMCVYHKMR